MIVLNRVRALSTKQKVIAGVSAAVVVAAGVGIGIATTQNTPSRPVAAGATLTPAYAALERDATPRPSPAQPSRCAPQPFTRDRGAASWAGHRRKTDDTSNGRLSWDDRGHRVRRAGGGGTNPAPGDLRR